MGFVDLTIRQNVRVRFQFYVLLDVVFAEGYNLINDPDIEKEEARCSMKTR